MTDVILCEDENEQICGKMLLTESQKSKKHV